MSKINIALAGNPNCGKTTMFNALTGANQYVGNWPGVTVEKKTGKVKNEKDILITDLPGVYSLSPYTNEEIVTRDYLASVEPSVVIDIVDATNIERNLYLTTQIMELGKPVVIALNMIDSLKKKGDKIDVKKLKKKLGCKVVETIALYEKGLKEITTEAKNAIGTVVEQIKIFSAETEESISKIQAILPIDINQDLKRWTAIKILERDKNVLEKIKEKADVLKKIEEITTSLEKIKDDDIESIITNERYEFVSKILDDVVEKSSSQVSISDKIDRIVTSRVFGIPIFIAVMWFVYWIAVSTVGTMATDWANDTVVGNIQNFVETLMTNAGANTILIDCIVNGIIGGLGAIFGFLPQMAILFLLLSILEDCGYMVRIAFVMDRLFRKFGLSGKSFIPLLISSGCGIPGIMASRTIENENDRRMTIMTTTWIPCGAKLPVIALMASVIASKLVGNDASCVGPLMYVIGIVSVLLAAIILKKTKYFHGPAAPFVMELPQYHIPQLKTVLIHTWERVKSFAIKAGTVLFIACLIMWFLSSYGFSESGFGLVSSQESLLALIGGYIRYIFIPLGFGGENGGCQASAAAISGFSAKEAIVSTMGVLANVAPEIAEAALEDEVAITTVVGSVGTWFSTGIAAFSFLMFNLLDSPCFAAIATMANELKSKKWFWFAIVFQNVFAYVITLIVYQLGMLFVHGIFGIGTIFALGFLLIILILLVRPNPYKEMDLIRY